jgi:hypothetical protein
MPPRAHGHAILLEDSIIVRPTTFSTSGQQLAEGL